MSRFSSKLGYVVAIVCLAMMVVALGAAAKHSQFESPDHSTHYLKQSVKMVTSSHSAAIEIESVVEETTLAAMAAAPMRLKPMFFDAIVPVRSPLLI